MDPREFLDDLRNESVHRRNVLYGTVGVDEDAEDRLQFSFGTDCEGWISIPVDHVESVDHLRLVACDDHTRPYVRLELNAPETGEGELYADLLSSVLSTGGGRTTSAPTSSPRTQFVEKDCFRLYEWCKEQNEKVPDANKVDCDWIFARCLFPWLPYRPGNRVVSG